MSKILDLACELIQHPSVTPDDNGCQDILIKRLEHAGFVVERMNANGVSNFWARHGDAGPVFAFAGHTDIVPTGPADQWRTPPFEPVIENGRLYGRGAADMKGSLAAMIIATENFLNAHPNHAGSIAFLITSDEEGPATHGTRHVMEQLTARGEKIDWCLVGEPSSHKMLGDVIRVGRRGSLNGKLTIRGKQGHVAYPELARNPVHLALPALAELAARHWDDGQPPFPPTSFQISNIRAGTGADNVIPGSLEANFNFRYSPAHDAASLKAAVKEILDNHKLDWQLDWRESGSPFYTEPGKLRDAVDEVIHAVTGIRPEHSTGGGTSDGRFIAPYDVQVVELGPVNASIHQIDEWTDIAELDQLGDIYFKSLCTLLVPKY